MGDLVEFPNNGSTGSGYLALPESGSGPGVVVIQEWWGLVDHIKDVCDRFAVEGFVALAPDLYRGETTTEPDEAGKLMMALNLDRAVKDMSGAVDYLVGTDAVTSEQVGVTGFCMGGALTLLAAVNVPEADAAVVWYGFPPLEYIDASKIKMPMLGHYAIDDVPFPIDKVDELEGKLRAARVDFEFHRYAAKHAFANETQVGANKLPITEYNAEAAALAWTRTLSFFDRHLR
jgi:carboxymethylenebutenolidase